MEIVCEILKNNIFIISVIVLIEHMIGQFESQSDQFSNAFVLFTNSQKKEMPSLTYDQCRYCFSVDNPGKMSLVVRKPVFGNSDQVRHKPGCTATEDS